MPKRVLIIGLGGTGKACLTILKERLLETYGQTPDNIVLLAMDTDGLRDNDTVNNVRLDPSEFLHIVSKPGITLDTVSADLALGRTTAYMGWLEKEKLDRIVSPSERDIRGGAQQRRPLGRLALFLQWRMVYDTIVDAITRMYGEPEEERPVDSVKVEQSKRLVFIVGSVAGGTGSGFVVDIANLVRHAVHSNSKWQSIGVSAIIVLPDAFSAYTTKMNDPTNLKPNSYAALRELDRFIRTHSTALPYMIRYDTDIRSITWSTNQPLDHVYLVDTASPSTIGDADLGGDPMRGVFPVISDFIMAHVDGSLGDTVATNRANAGQHYDKEEGWQYSSFNVMTYIFPADDVIESFSYRFLREMVARQFLPIADKKTRALVEQDALKETEEVFYENTVHGRVNPGVIQKAIAVTRRMGPETPDASWPGLFNLISLSESAYTEDYQDLEGWLSHLSSNLIPTKEGEYKREDYDTGYTRLLNLSEQFMDDCLGPRIDPNDEDARLGGEWDKILGRYREALRLRFSEALDAALLDALNRRDPRSKMLSPARLVFVRAMVATLKDKLVHFKEILKGEYGQIDIDARIRQTSEELRNAITWMYDTKDSRTFALLGKSDARKAQDAYIGLFYDKMEMLLHQRIYRVVIDVLDALGAADYDQDKNPSVIDHAALELENWQATWQEVDKLLARWERTHEKNRADKKQVKVRRYLTNPEFEDQLYRLPEHSGIVGTRVLGQVRGETGMTWERVEETDPLGYKLVTMWTEEARGAEKIAQGFFSGAKQLFQVVRESVTVADRVEDEFTSSASFVNVAGQINEPFLRYHPAVNDKTMFHERYVSFNLTHASDEARRFLDDARSTLRDQGMNIDVSAESQGACTILEIARGVRLSAVDQFVACEPDYRAKLYKGRGSLHLFPEEQNATDYEGRIETLGEPDNRQRPLSPELVVAMGDEAKLNIFTMACAYGLIREGTFWNDETGQESTEIFLNLKQNGAERRLLLSDSHLVRALVPLFNALPTGEQLARLYLNALQNFVLKVTQKPSVPDQMMIHLVDHLKRLGVSLGHIENPFTVSVGDVSQGVRQVAEAVGLSEKGKPSRSVWVSTNARCRVEQYLQPFLSEKVVWFKRSDAQSVRDMGTVMHLVLQEEISRLLEQIQDKVFQVIHEYDAVLSLFSSIGRKAVADDVVWMLARENIESQFHIEQHHYLVRMCRHFEEMLTCPAQTPRLVNGLFVTELDTTHFMEDVLFERQEARISPRIPLVFSGWRDFGTKEAEILQLSLQDFNQSIALLVLFDKQDALDYLRPIIVDKMKSGHGIDVVAIGHQEIEDLLDSPTPLSRFRSFFLARIDIDRISPYNITGPVVGDLVFSGREEELRAIAGRIGASSYFLIGGRRFGKTSILLRLHRFRLPAAGFRTVYHDCSTTSTYDTFLAATIRDWRPEPPPAALATFSDLLQSSFEDKPLVLLLDEADKLVPADRAAGWPLFNALRALSNSGRAQIVLSGERTLRDALRDPKSPLFNFANEMLLGSLDFRAVDELITRPMKQLEIELEDEKAIVDRIWAFTSGHPNVVQRLCHRLIKRLNEQGTRRIRLDDVDVVIEDPGFQRNDFLSTYWEAATPLEKIISLLMTNNETVRTMSAVRQALANRCNLHPKARDVDDALQRLVDLRSLLKRTPTGYEFAVEAFPRVVAGTITLDDMLEILTEEYQEQSE